MQGVTVHIDHKYDSFPCPLPFFDLLQEVGVKHGKQVSLQATRLDVSQVLLVHCYQAFCLLGAGSIGNHYPCHLNRVTIEGP
jgi:hypothetical protein